MAKAYDNIRLALEGKKHLGELSDAEMSAIRLQIYNAAVELLEMSDKRMAEAAMKIPDEIRNLVREECKRLLKLRRK